MTCSVIKSVGEIYSSLAPYQFENKEFSFHEVIAELGINENQIAVINEEKPSFGAVVKYTFSQGNQNFTSNTFTPIATRMGLTAAVNIIGTYAIPILSPQVALVTTMCGFIWGVYSAQQNTKNELAEQTKEVSSIHRRVFEAFWQVHDLSEFKNLKCPLTGNLITHGKAMRLNRKGMLGWFDRNYLNQLLENGNGILSLDNSNFNGLTKNDFIKSGCEYKMAFIYFVNIKLKADRAKIKAQQGNEEQEREVKDIKKLMSKYIATLSAAVDNLAEQKMSKLKMKSDHQEKMQRIEDFHTFMQILTSIGAKLLEV